MAETTIDAEYMIVHDYMTAAAALASGQSSEVKINGDIYNKVRFMEAYFKRFSEVTVPFLHTDAVKQHDKGQIMAMYFMIDQVLMRGQPAYRVRTGNFEDLEAQLNHQKAEGYNIKQIINDGGRFRLIVEAQ